jgi:hypothetical protein
MNAMRHARILLRPIFALTLVAAWSATSFAQTPAPPSAPENAKPEAAPTPGDKSSGVPLSKKLDENEGVLKPPHDIDPKMNRGAPAKTGDKMPVIIPPGEPGGDQSIQPK